MKTLATLLDELSAQDKNQDFVGMRATREAIANFYPQTHAAAEAIYKIGLDILFRERNLPEAISKFEQAAALKHPFWSNAARTSLGLCYYHQKRLQKALFELRKVGYSQEPTVHSVTALAFVENIFSNENKPVEVLKVRKDRITQLTHLIQDLDKQHQQTPDLPLETQEQLGYYLYMLGVALKDDGQTSMAHKYLERAKNLGKPILGADLTHSLEELLQEKTAALPV